MRSPYHPAEIRAAMTLKSLTIKAIAEELSVSRRTLDYFINEGRFLRKADEFLEILQPELREVSKIYRKHTNKNYKSCEKR